MPQPRATWRDNVRRARVRFLQYVGLFFLMHLQGSPLSSQPPRPQGLLTYFISHVFCASLSSCVGVLCFSLCLFLSTIRFSTGVRKLTRVGDLPKLIERKILGLSSASKPLSVPVTNTKHESLYISLSPSWGYIHV